MMLNVEALLQDQDLSSNYNVAIANAFIKTAHEYA